MSHSGHSDLFHVQTGIDRSSSECGSSTDRLPRSKKHSEFTPIVLTFDVCSQEVHVPKALVKEKLLRATNISLEPVMSDSLGNYEPKDLPDRSGPGEGGEWGESCQR